MLGGLQCPLVAPEKLKNIVEVLPRRPPPPHEVGAYKALAGLCAATCSFRRGGWRRAREGPPDYDPGWHFKLPTAEDALELLPPEPERPMRDLGRPPEPGRAEILAAVRTEGERLPPELRSAYYAVLWKLFQTELTSTVKEELAAPRGSPSDPPSPSLRLVAAIVRNWG
jgi:hypothetical protein